MDKIKVLIIAASLRIGGAEKVARDIARYADPERYVFHYVVFGDAVGEYEPELLAQGCEIFHLAQPSHGYIRYLRALKALMAQHRYHAVHAHNMFSCGWVMWMADRMGIPVRVTHAHSALDNGSGFLKSAYERFMRRLILHHSTDLVACGEAAGRRLFGSRAYEARGNVILNGIEAEMFAFDPDRRNRIRRQYDLDERFVLGHAGHLAQVKNQAFLLDLMPLILQRKPDAALFLLGEGEDRPMLEQKIREMGLEQRVMMTGNVSDVSDYLSAMDVFVFPSLYEGMPLSVLEVQANGLPCVISDRVPKDVFVTDLLQPLHLSVEKGVWAEAVCTAVRRNPEAYNQQMRSCVYDIKEAMGKIYGLYARGC